MGHALNTSAPDLLVEKGDDHIAVITLNRPRVRNAINAAMSRALEEAVQDLEADQNVWVVIITGAGPDAFCAGADLKEVSEGKLLGIIGGPNGLAGFVQAARSKPWIAAVEGLALAGGCEIALACDMIVATESGAFGLPEVKRGLIASEGGAYRLPRSIAPAIAIECLVTGNRLSAKRAADFGMVNRLVAQGEALNGARGLAREITANAPLAVRESLNIARQSIASLNAEFRALSRAAQDRIQQTNDFAEGSRAFVEKRDPVWEGR